VTLLPSVAKAPSALITLAWGARVSTDFAAAVIGLCRRLRWSGAHASWLMACMAFESDETFSASVRNKAGSGAVGLIQFMPATARGIGTTVGNLELLSAESQLYYVQQYFAPYAHRIASLSDMYMAILLPKYIGTRDSVVLFSGGTVAYRQNAGLDADNDGRVTQAEATARVAAKLQRGLQPGFSAPYVFEAAP
jgi:spore maturation protein SpmB